MSADLLGTPRPFVHRDKTYQVCPRDLTTRTMFAQWVRNQAALELWKLKATAPPDFYREQMEIYNSKLVGKEMEWGSRDVHLAYWSESGQKHMLWLKMKRGEQKGGDFVTPDFIEEIAQDAEKWEELKLIMWEQDDPAFFAQWQEEAKKTPLNAPSSPPMA